MRVYWHDDCLLHDTGTGVFGSGPSPLIAVPELHPENVERVRNMRSALERGPLAGALEWHPGRHASEAELATIHHAEHIDRVRDFCAAGGGFLTASTPVVPASWQAALAAAGTTLAAAEAVLAGECTTAYALVRPPGHHAQPDRPDGYCLFANAALAAELARRRGVERIAIVDWDVHHGNGTQECFYERADVLTVSLHMDHRSWGADHPQSGLPDEVGRAAGTGFNINVAFPMGVGDEGYLAAMGAVVEPLVRRVRPRPADRDVRPGREPVRPERPPVRDHGRLPRARARRPPAGRRVLRGPPPARPGGWLRAHLLRPLPAGDRRRRPGRRHRRRRPAGLPARPARPGRFGDRRDAGGAERIPARSRRPRRGLASGR